MKPFSLALAFTVSICTTVVGEPNPLAALDIEKIASQVATSDTFRDEVRRVFSTLAAHSQTAAKGLITAMSGPERMKPSGTPVDEIVARHLGVALLPLIKDPETKVLVQTHSESGSLDKLLIACMATEKPTVVAEPSIKVSPAQKKLIEKRLVGMMWEVSDGSGLAFYFERDGTTHRYEGGKPRKETRTGKWEILDNGFVHTRMSPWNYMVTVEEDGTATFSVGKFDETGVAQHGDKKTFTSSPDEKMPRPQK